MSEQHGPAKTPLPTETPRWLKGRRDKAAKPTVADFPLGARFVARLKESDGFATLFLCEIVDAYDCKALARWDDPICIYAKILKATERRHADLVGHLTKISLGTDTWYHRQICLTNLPEEQPWLSS